MKKIDINEILTDLGHVLMKTHSGKLKCVSFVNQDLPEEFRASTRQAPTEFALWYKS